VFLTEKCL